MDVPALYLELKDYWADVDKLTFIVALLACFVAWRTWRTQHTHNRLSVMPLPGVRLSASGEELCIKLANDGNGPLRVLSLRFVASNGTELENASTIVSTPDKETLTLVDGRALSPNSSCVILMVAESEHQPEGALENAAKELAPFTIVLRYTDVYGTKFEPITRDLDWFTTDH